jgi:hypothetical protein
MSAKSKQAPAKAAAALVSKKKAAEVAESSGDESGSEDSNSLLKSLAAQFALFSTQMSKDGGQALCLLGG